MKFRGISESWRYSGRNLLGMESLGPIALPAVGRRAKTNEWSSDNSRGAVGVWAKLSNHDYDLDQCSMLAALDPRSVSSIRGQTFGFWRRIEGVTPEGAPRSRSVSSIRGQTFGFWRRIEGVTPEGAPSNFPQRNPKSFFMETPEGEMGRNGATPSKFGKEAKV